jgi:porphobilinogen synthase
MIRETDLSVDDLVYPLFVVPGKGIKKPIASMPGHFQMSGDHLVKEVQRTKEMGIPAVLLFGIPEKKDEVASGAFAKDGIIQQAVKRLRTESTVSRLLPMCVSVNTPVTVTVE